MQHPIFVSEIEARTLRFEDERDWFMPPSLEITEAQLLGAISEVERFSEWFDPQIEFK